MLNVTETTACIPTPKPVAHILGLIGALALLTAESIDIPKKAEKHDPTPTNSQPAQMSRRATVELKAKIREAREKFNNDPENQFLSVNLVSNLVSSPSVPEAVRTVLRNPEVVKAIIASGHDNKVLALHLKQQLFPNPNSKYETNPVSEGVAIFTQFALNQWNAQRTAFNVAQGRGLAEDAGIRVAQFSSTNALQHWEEGIINNTAEQVWHSNRVNVAIAAIAPGGPRAPLALDGLVGKSTASQIQHAIYDMTAPFGWVVQPDVVRTAEDLKKYSIASSPANFMLHLCNVLRQMDPMYDEVVKRHGIDYRIAEIRAGK